MGGSHNARSQEIPDGQAQDAGSRPGPDGRRAGRDSGPLAGLRHRLRLGLRLGHRLRLGLRAGCRRRSGQDKGAVAVEFALVVPVFVMLVLGLFEFGRAFNIQVSLSEAARESVRYAAVHSADADFTVGAAQAAGVAAAPTVPLQKTDVVISFRNPDSSSAGSCAAGVNVISTVTYRTGFLTGLEKLIGVSQPFTVNGKGVMRCGG